VSAGLSVPPGEDPLRSLIEAALAEFGEGLRAEAARLHHAAFFTNSHAESGSFANAELRAPPGAPP